MFGKPQGRPITGIDRYDAAILQDLVTQTSDCTGQALYENALDWLQQWFKADICFIGEIEDGVSSIRAIQGHSRRQLRVGSQYEMAGTPCERREGPRATSWLDCECSPAREA